MGARWCRRLNVRNEGAIYDKLCRERASNGLLSSYLPRNHPTYGAAFKLMDLSAGQFNHDWHSESSSSGSSDSSSGTESDSEDEEEADGLAPTVLGKSIDDEAE